MQRKETHQKAITRVAQWLDLPKDKSREFVQLAHDIATSQEGDYTKYDEAYLQHLEQKVFPNDRIISFLRNSQVGSNTIKQFESENIPFEDVYRSWNEIRYSTNEILDLTMLLKLINEVSEQSEASVVESRYKLQKLVYLVNKELVEQEKIDSDTAPYDHGNLEKTGFRYTYRKRDSGPFSKDLEEDRHRLYASNLIDEVLVDNSTSPEINERIGRFEITLGVSGEVLMKRFSELLQNMETDVLAEWERAIQSVVREFGPMSTERLQTHIKSIESVEEADDRKLLIRGRKVEYDTEPWLEVSAEGGVSYV